MTISYSLADFLRWLFVTIACGMMFAIGLVVLVDPYGLYRLAIVPGFNWVKPDFTRHLDEIKLVQAVNLKPDTVILGNSRAEIGFDPESAPLMRRGHSAYNLAIRGTGLDSSRKQLEYLRYSGIKPRLIIIGLEYVDFLRAPDTPPAPKQRPNPTGPIYPVEAWFWRFDSLVSMTSVKDSLRTLFIQSDGEASTITFRGFNPLNEYRALARNEGYFAIFRQRAQEYVNTFLAKAGGMPDPSDFDDLRAILDIAAEANSEVRLIIYPYHAQLLALFEEMGLWPGFEQWKQMIVAEVSATRLRHSDARIELLDASGYNSYHCEKIPAKGDRKSSTRWYWEAGHFKKELGDIVLETALSSPDKPRLGTDSEKPSFHALGVYLDAASLISNQNRIARERAECASAYPELFSEAAALSAATRVKKHL